MSLKNKLQRMKGHLGLEKTGKEETDGKVELNGSKVPTESSRIDVPYLQDWANLQAAPFGTADEYVIVREVRYPITARHGNYAFQQLHEVIDAWGSAGMEHPLSSAGKNAANLLFFDTETTGLHGGAGNTIFLLGYSRLEADEVVVRQHFLAQPHAEATLYQSFLADVEASKDLVTFNGKSFDWPQVKTRHTLVRHSVPELPVFGHYDLLHGARRMWKDELESCRLSLIEQTKLGITRDHDVPGFMAPILYFDYLTEHDPRVIQGVLIHNEVDVLTLITLYIHLSYLLLNQGDIPVSLGEIFEIGRWYEAIGADLLAMDRYQRVADSDHYLRGKAILALGLLYKKQNQWRDALHIWEKIIRENKSFPEAIYIEAAKICEHQLKDYEKAIHYTRLGLEQMKRRGQLLRRGIKSELGEYQKRLERLEKKMRR